MRDRIKCDLYEAWPGMIRCRHEHCRYQFGKMPTVACDYQTPDGVGTIFAGLVKPWRVKVCSSCWGTQRELNRIGPDGVEQNMEYFASQIHSRAGKVPKLVIKATLALAIRIARSRGKRNGM